MEGTGMRTPDGAAARYSYLFPIGYSYYAIATSLTPAFYQKLVDRCWRRSGSLLYRPNQKHSCCPHYTLRLDSTQFRPTKDQRQAVNRFNRHVLGDTYARDAARLHPRTRAEARRRHNVFDLAERVHEPEAGALPPAPPAPDHAFTVTLEPDTFTEEKYAIFENYQRLVHREPPGKISRHGFRRFLCESPLSRETFVAPGGRERPLGSFHQCYRIDGKLVAVGVLDLLPDCVSAVYFLYHESIHWLNPGKLGALREIALAREMGYRWWYPGYYVHGCAKMRYKIEYKPQYVLDPEDLRWYPLDRDALKRFDSHHYVVFSREQAEGEGGVAQAQAVVASETKADVSSSTSASGQSKTQATSGTAPTMETGAESTEQEKDEEGEEREVDDDDSREVEDEEEEEEEEAFLLSSTMPGIPTLAEMRRVDMDGLVLRTDFSDNLIVASHLVIWETEDIAQFGALKSRIAELVAAVGPDLLGEMCIDFRKRSA